MSTVTGRDHRAGRDPVHQDAEWLDIYARLKQAIGEWPAFNWFGACHFLRRRDGVIRLQHWGAFLATEALKRHGFDLCRVAGVERAEIDYSGGYYPNDGSPPPPKEGRAVFTMPAPNSGRAHLTHKAPQPPVVHDEMERFL